MRDASVTGMVLSSMPVNDYDRRVVILTRERGKIAAFARGARRPNSHLAAASRTFATGEFELFANRDSYSLKSANILEYFENLSADLESAYYAYFFAEMAEYCTRENNDESMMLALIYAALRALSRDSIPNEMVRAVFQLKTMILSGDYPGDGMNEASDTVKYAENFVIETVPSKLFSFTLKEEAAAEFIGLTDTIREYYIKHEFSSLEILRQII